jgi:hypothetical protein
VSLDFTEIYKAGGMEEEGVGRSQVLLPFSARTIKSFSFLRRASMSIDSPTSLSLYAALGEFRSVDRDSQKNERKQKKEKGRKKKKGKKVPPSCP